MLPFGCQVSWGHTPLIFNGIVGSRFKEQANEAGRGRTALLMCRVSFDVDGQVKWCPASWLLRVGVCAASTQELDDLRLVVLDGQM